MNSTDVTFGEDEPGEDADHPGCPRDRRDRGEAEHPGRDEEHGRILTLRLTEHGLAMRDHCQRLVARVERQMLAPFSQAERAAFVAAMLRAGDALLAGRPRRRARPNA
jgi:hypothetical protein